MRFGIFYTIRYYAIVLFVTTAVVAMWYDGATNWNDGPNTVETLRFLHEQATCQPANFSPQESVDPSCFSE
jgi:hypothetical protein